MAHVFDDRLYVPAIDNVILSMEHHLRTGWVLRAAHRHSGEDWTTCPTDEYGALTGSELVQLADAVLTELLGWP